MPVIVLTLNIEQIRFPAQTPAHFHGAVTVTVKLATSNLPCARGLNRVVPVTSRHTEHQEASITNWTIPGWLDMGTNRVTSKTNKRERAECNTIAGKVSHEVELQIWRTIERRNNTTQCFAYNIWDSALLYNKDPDTQPWMLIYMKKINCIDSQRFSLTAELDCQRQTLTIRSAFLQVHQWRTLGFHV